MTSQPSPNPLQVADARSPASSGSELAAMDLLSFQFVDRSQLTSALSREITDFLDSQDTSHPFQLTEWGGEQARLALLRKNGQLRWFAQCGVFYPAGTVVRPIRALTVNRGPVCDHVELMEAGLQRLVQVGQRMRVAYIDIAPEWSGPFAESASSVLQRTGWQALSGSRCSLRLNLSPDPDQLLMGFGSVTRYKIRKCMRQGIEVRRSTEESERGRFLQMYLEMAKTKQFVPDSPDHVRRILDLLARQSNRGAFLIAHKDGKVLGGAVVVRAGRRCWYIMGATSKEEGFSAGHLMQWESILWAKDQGCREYDFGGYREGATSGPAFFKRGFCENVVHFPSPHRYVVSPSRLHTSDLISRVRRSLRRSPRS